MSAVDIIALDGSLLSNEQPQPLPLELAGFSRIPEVYDILILIHISLLCMIIVHSQSLSVSDGYISYYIYSIPCLRPSSHVPFRHGLFAMTCDLDLFLVSTNAASLFQRWR